MNKRLPKRYFAVEFRKASRSTKERALDANTSIPLLQQLGDHEIPVVDHHLGDPVALRLLVFQVPDALVVEADDVRSGHGQQDGRVGDDDVLRSLPDHLGNPGEERELALRGERRLRFIHDEKARPREGPDETQETLAMGQLVQGPVPIHGAAQFLLILDGLGGDVVETLGPEEKPAAGALDRTLPDGYRIAEFGVVVVRGEVVVQRSALGVEPVGNGDSLQQGRFPGAVLSDEERHGPTERKLLQQADRRNPRQVGVRGNLVPVDTYSVDVHKKCWALNPQGGGRPRLTQPAFGRTAFRIYRSARSCIAAMAIISSRRACRSRVLVSRVCKASSARWRLWCKSFSFTWIAG